MPLDTPLRYACDSSGLRADPPPPAKLPIPPPPRPNCLPPPPCKFWQIAGGGSHQDQLGPVVVAPPLGAQQHNVFVWGSSRYPCLLQPQQCK